MSSRTAVPSAVAPTHRLVGRLRPSLPLAALAVALAGCGGGDDAARPAAATTTTAAPTGAVAVENCGVRRTVTQPVRRIVATSNSANVGTLLRIGAVDRLAAVSLAPGNDAVMRRLYGDGIERIPRLTSPISMEAVLGKRPDLLIGSYSGLFAGSSGVTVERTAERGVTPYVISDSCRQDPAAGERSKLGTMDPWDAVRTDLRNYGALTGHATEAARARAELDRRLGALRTAPRPARAPKVLLFDSGTKDLYTSGRNGPPQGIIEAAGGENVFAGQDTTWFQASWESAAAAKPDAIVVMDYRSGEAGEVEQKLRTLRSRAGLRDLPVVRRDRIVVLPLALFTSGYPNIEAAEQVRGALERFGLVPSSGAAPRR